MEIANHIHKGLEGYFDNKFMECLSLYKTPSKGSKLSGYYGIFRVLNGFKDNKTFKTECYCVAHNYAGLYFTTLPECYAYLMGLEKGLHKIKKMNPVCGLGLFDYGEKEYKHLLSPYLYDNTNGCHYYLDSGFSELWREFDDEWQERRQNQYGLIAKKGQENESHTN